MERRSAIKSLLLIGGAIAFMPSCVGDKKKASIHLSNLDISADQEALLGSVVDTIIPKTDTPGGKDLKLHLFALKMMDDLYDKDAQEKFVKGMDQFARQAEDRYGKPFTACSQKQREELLTGIEKNENQRDVAAFYPVLKNLTIQGYLNSQYVMSKLLVYELVPGRFHGCVPVKKS